MEYDAIPFTHMSPDSSDWEKGLRLVVNAIPESGGTWREVHKRNVLATLALTVNTSLIGEFSDPDGTIYFGTADSGTSTSRLYGFAGTTFTNLTPGADYANKPRFWRFTKFGASVIAAPTILSGAAIQLQVRAGGVGNFANLVTSADRPAPRFVAVSKSHVLGAYNNAIGGAGVYAAADPYQFMWCARNNAADWTPGTDRAGFQNVSDSLGVITGLAGFKDFSLLFQQHGVTRLSWIGGEAVWEAQEIATHDCGISADFVNSPWSGSLLRVRRDLFYLSNSGPAVVRNGEAVEFLGEGQIRRFLMDQLTGSSATSDFTIDPQGEIDAEFCPYTSRIIWTLKHKQGNGNYFLLVYDLKERRFSIIDGLPSVRYVGVRRATRPTNPLDNFVFLEPVLPNINAIDLAGSGTLEQRYETKRWRPGTGQRSVVHGLRPLLSLDLRGGSYPAVSVAISASPEPRFDSPLAATVSTASVDGNGWISDAAFPLEVGEARFTVTVPDLGANPTQREFPALELAHAPSSVF